MMKDAESHADEDKKRQEEIETRNQADQAVYAAERMLERERRQAEAADRMAIESAMADLKRAIEKNDVAGDEERMDALNRRSTRRPRLYSKPARRAARVAGRRRPPPGGVRGDGVLTRKGRRRHRCGSRWTTKK